MSGPEQIEQTLAAIFASHATGRYVGFVRSVRALADELIRAASGVIPAGAEDTNPELNAEQTLLLVGGHIALYQNTPAQLHGQPEAAAALTAELRSQVASFIR